MPEQIPPPQTIVVFGASGDLSRRKIFPALYNLARDGLLPEQYAVVGYAPDGWDDAAFTEYVRQSVAQFSRSSLTEEAWGRFAPHLHFVSGSFDQPQGLDPLETRLTELDKTLGTEGHRLLFCAVPASIVPTLITRLGECGPQPTHRVVPGPASPSTSRPASACPARPPRSRSSSRRCRPPSSPARG